MILKPLKKHHAEDGILFAPCARKKEKRQTLPEVLNDSAHYA